MDTRSVSRCVAVAAHGRRCQQSPFRGSPYCWHHTQSRKIPAPSRPPDAVPSPPATVRGGTAADGGDGTDRRRNDAAARRLGALMGPRRVAEMLAFLEGEEDGSFHLIREDGRLMTGRSNAVSGMPAARRAAG